MGEEAGRELAAPIKFGVFKPVSGRDVLFRRGRLMVARLRGRDWRQRVSRALIQKTGGYKRRYVYACCRPIYG